MKGYLLFIILLGSLFQKASGQLTKSEMDLIVAKTNCFWPGTVVERKDTLRIGLRCAATPMPDKPLFIIDGVMAEDFELQQIDPNDIESIWVLKDGEAQALYGCRAMRGAVIVTTKPKEKTIIVRDVLTHEPLAGASMVINRTNGPDIRLIADSTGKISIRAIPLDENYEINVSHSGYNTYTRYINSRQLGKESSILLERKYKELLDVRVKSVGGKSRYDKMMWGMLRCIIGGIYINMNGDSIGVIEKVEKSVKIYPNPVNRLSSINFEFTSTSRSTVIMRILTIDHKLIAIKKFVAIDGLNRFNYALDTRLSAGIYVIQLYDENKNVLKTERLIIQ